MANSFSFQTQSSDRQIRGEIPSRYDLLTGDTQGSELLDEVISNCCPKSWYDFLHYILISKSPQAHTHNHQSPSPNPKYCYSFNKFSKFFQIWKSTLGKEQQKYNETNAYYIKTWLLDCQSHINDYLQNHKNESSKAIKKQRLQTISTIFRKLYQYRIGRHFSDFYIEWAKYYILRKKYKKAKKKIKLGIKYPVKYGMDELNDFYLSICQKENEMISNSNNLAYLYEDSASSLSSFSESTYGQNTESENEINENDQSNTLTCTAPSLKNNHSNSFKMMEVDIEQTRSFDNNHPRSSLSTLPQRCPQMDDIVDTENDSEDHFDAEEEEEDESEEEIERENGHFALPQINENVPISSSPLKAKKHNLRTPFAAINNPNNQNNKNKANINLTVHTKRFVAPFTPNTLIRNMQNGYSKPNKSFTFANRNKNNPSPILEKETKKKSPKGQQIPTVKTSNSTSYTSTMLKQRQSTPYNSRNTSHTNTNGNTQQERSKHVQFDVENKNDSYSSHSPKEQFHAKRRKTSQNETSQTHQSSSHDHRNNKSSHTQQPPCNGSNAHNGNHQNHQQSQHRHQPPQQKNCQHQHQQQRQQSQHHPSQQQRQQQQRNKSSFNVITINGRSMIQLKRIGRGGSSEVFQVITRDTFEILALKKIIVSNSVELDEQNQRRDPMENFQNEIDLLLKLRNKPYCIQMLDYEIISDTNQTKIRMLFESGEIDLSQLLKSQKNRFFECILQIQSYWKQILLAVDTVHGFRIVHGDLKPANFLMVKGQLKLIDFGIAKMISSNETTRIARDSQIGTLNYISPEALIGDNNSNCYKLGRSADVWSLGCILHQMCFGFTPFTHLKFAAKLTAIVSENCSMHIKKSENAMINDIIRRCLKRKPAERITVDQLLAHQFLNPFSR